jgi:hypothetical protein
MQRRAMLAGSSGAFAAIAAFALPAAAQQATPSSDAELLKLCENYQRLNAVASRGGLDDDTMDTLVGDIDDILDAITALPASTPDGVRAKARIGIVLIHEDNPGFGYTADARFLLAALQDVVGGVA